MDQYVSHSFDDPVIAGRMFARWCQENFFVCMMEHVDIDGLVQYGCEEIPGATEIVNPAWRNLDKNVSDKRREPRTLRSEITVMHPFEIGVRTCTDPYLQYK